MLIGVWQEIEASQDGWDWVHNQYVKYEEEWVISKFFCSILKILSDVVYCAVEMTANWWLVLSVQYNEHVLFSAPNLSPKTKVHGNFPNTQW